MSAPCGAAAYQRQSDLTPRFSQDSRGSAGYRGGGIVNASGVQHRRASRASGLPALMLFMGLRVGWNWTGSRKKLATLYDEFRGVRAQCQGRLATVGPFRCESEEDQNFFEAIKSGAQGYLLMKIEPRELSAMLRDVVQGDAPTSRARAGKILREFAGQAQRAASTPLPGAELSLREKEVLELVTQGKSNKETATALAIAENTGKNHLKNILEKLHLENRVQAAMFALREGLVETLPGRPGWKTRLVASSFGENSFGNLSTS